MLDPVEIDSDGEKSPAALSVRRVEIHMVRCGAREPVAFRDQSVSTDLLAHACVSDTKSDRSLFIERDANGSYGRFVTSMLPDLLPEANKSLEARWPAARTEPLGDWWNELTGLDGLFVSGNDLGTSIQDLLTERFGIQADGVLTLLACSCSVPVSVPPPPQPSDVPSGPSRAPQAPSSPDVPSGPSRAPQAPSSPDVPLAPADRVRRRFAVLSAPTDARYRRDLYAHLAPFERAGLVQVWHEDQMQAGEDLNAVVERILSTADVVLLIVSKHLFESTWDRPDVRRARLLGEQGALKLIPVLVRPCAWDVTSLGQLQPLPQSGKPITRWSDRAEAWLSVVNALRPMVPNDRSA